MTATQTTARAFGSCMIRGCRHKHVTDLTQIGGKVYFHTATGALRPAACDGSREGNAAMRAAGLACPTHGAEMVYRPVRGTVNPDKTCDSRCEHAKTAACDCSCGGERHGIHQL